MTIFGILNARAGIGIGRLINNFILGTLTYLFLVISAMILIEILRLSQASLSVSRLTIKRARMLFGVIFRISIAVATYHSIITNLSFYIVIVAVIIGIIWISLAYYASFGKKSGLVVNIIISLSFSMGLMYGAVITNYVVPSFIYSFLLAAFFLQFAREIVKGCKNVEDKKSEDFEPLALTYGTTKALKFSLYFQMTAVIFLILPIFTNILNATLYFFAMIAGIIVISSATYLTAKSKPKNRNLKKINFFLKIGILVELIAFLFASV